MNIITIINEEIQKFEGVADKYAEREFHIEDPNKIQNLKAMQSLLGKPFAVVNQGRISVPIYKNPQTLEGFDEDVRAIAMTNGDLYVMQIDADIMHGKMGKAIGLVEVYNQEYDVLLHRVGYENAFGLGDSGSGFATYNINNWKNTITILRAAKKVNPQFEFYPVYFHEVKKIEAEPIDANGDDVYDYPVDEFGEPIFDNQ